MAESNTIAMIGWSQSCFLRNNPVVVSVCETLRVAHVMWAAGARLLPWWWVERRKRSRRFIGGGVK